MAIVNSTVDFSVDVSSGCSSALDIQDLCTLYNLASPDQSKRTTVGDILKHLRKVTLK